ncbi:uncharacterized protein LOC130736724 [Lotus japonicus]|uniref:uncharacterized protein LOC130736724 n=1 Tax=Lotus japonicus TaxID=34305 RepID=UPI00258B2166|nr:uncharacterized protein LOC130736724 [Lotus japonicus]
MLKKMAFLFFWSEPDLYIQQGFVSMPQNPTIHQYGYGPMLLDQASSSVSPSYSNHVQEPDPVAMTENSLGFTTPMSPALHDVEYWISEFNLEPNTCDIQGQRDILHQTTTLSSNIQCSQDLEIERLLGHVRAYEMQKNLTASASMNGVTQCNKGKNLESSSTSFPSLQEFNSTILGFSSPTTIEDGLSSHVLISTNAKTSLLTREQPSANILKILNTNDKEAFFIPSKGKRGRPRKPLSEELIKQLEKFQPLPLGRPPKRREGGESFSNLGKFQKRYSGARTIGMTAKPKVGHKTPENVQNEYQSPKLTNPYSAPRQYLNSAYDPKYHKDGDFVDPHLKLFNTIIGK